MKCPVVTVTQCHTYLAGAAQTDAVAAYLEAKGDGEALAAAKKVKFEAEARLAELLAETVQQRGRPSKSADRADLPKLADLGLSSHDSRRARAVAAVPAAAEVAAMLRRLLDP